MYNINKNYFAPYEFDDKYATSKVDFLNNMIIYLGGELHKEINSFVLVPKTYEDNILLADSEKCYFDYKQDLIKERNKTL